MKKQILSVVFLAFPTSMLWAQSGTNSPYSQYGMGLIADEGTGFNRGMNGLGLGFHTHNQVNAGNPASYAALDSLSFIFDVGVSGQLTNFKANGVSRNAKNAVFDYATAGFRIAKHAGISFGVVPLTTIGYNYAYTRNLNAITSPIRQTATDTYAGSGGLHTVYLGVGWSPVRNLSVGANVGYLWGNITRSVINSYSDASINTLSKYYSASINNYKVDFGAQYTAEFSKKDALTLGVTYGLSHKLGADATCEVISKNAQTGVSSTETLTIQDAFKLPTMYGVGLMYEHNNTWRVGADYTLMQYNKVGYADYQVVNHVQQYTLRNDVYQDRHKFTVGGEFCKNEYGRRFTDRLRYRLGASYVTPYYKVNGVDGPKEYSVSAGVGIPIVNSIENRTALNISASWVRREATNLLKENTFRLTLGLTFNEQWFAKWKFK